MTDLKTMPGMPKFNEEELEQIERNKLVKSLDRWDRFYEIGTWIIVAIVSFLISYFLWI